MGTKVSGVANLKWIDYIRGRLACGGLRGEGEQMHTRELTCPRCQSHEIEVQVVPNVRIKHRGILMWMFWILIAIFTLGIILLIIPLITNTKTQSKFENVAVCQHCGQTWKLK